MKFFNAYEHIVPIVDVIAIDNNTKIKNLTFLGTGVFISKGCILTCRHVIESAKNIICSVYNIKNQPVYDGLKNIKSHPTADLAIAEVGEKAKETYKPLKLDLESERWLGKDILNFSYVNDFHENYQVALTPRLFKGHIMRTSEERNDPKNSYIEINFPALKGMSGSPIIDANTSDVLGIVYQNFRTQILEDEWEDYALKDKESEITEKTTIYRVVDFAKAVNLSPYKDFIESNIKIS